MAEERRLLSPEACRAAAQISRLVDRALVDSDLSAAGYRLLAYLSTGESAAKTLAMKLAVSRPTVTATLDWLEPRGYVTRSADPNDRRRLTIAITEKGHKELSFADQLVGRRLLSVLHDLDDSDYGSTIAALEQFHQAVNRYRTTTAAKTMAQE